MAEAIYLPPARNFIKKLNDKKLKNLIRENIEEIKKDYEIGSLKTGDLSGIYSLDVFYNKTNYEIAYKTVIRDDKVIVVIMIGTREKLL